MANLSYLPQETRGYVPAFIAANYVMNYYCEHNICPMTTTLPPSTDTIIVDRDVHFDQIVAVCNVKAEEVKALNPQYRTGLIPGAKKSCILRLPTTVSARSLRPEIPFTPISRTNCSPTVAKWL